MASTISRTGTTSFRNDWETTSTDESADSSGCYICFERCRIASTFARLWGCDWFESQPSGIVGGDGAEDEQGSRGNAFNIPPLSLSPSPPLFRGLVGNFASYECDRSCTANRDLWHSFGTNGGLCDWNLGDRSSG